jgi:hypothetical protein
MKESFGQEEPRVSQQVFAFREASIVGKHDERASASIEKKEKEIVGKIRTQ